MLGGQYDSIGIPVQNELELAPIGPERGLLDQRMLRVNAASTAAASEVIDKAAKVNFIVIWYIV